MRNATGIKLALALGLSSTLAACGQSETPTPRPEPTPAAVLPQEPEPENIEELIGQQGDASAFEAYAYDCGGMQIAVRPAEDELTLIFPDRSVLLPQVEAASGARYDDGDTAFWAKGAESALLTMAGEDISCQLDRRATPWVDARGRGVLFRGFGTEPGWHVEIQPDQIVMVYQYGQQRVTVPNPGAVADPDQPLRRWMASTEAHELEILVESRACTDTMSGEVFPATVTVKLDGRDYIGCGRDLD